MRKWMSALYGSFLYLLVANLIFIDTEVQITVAQKSFMTCLSILLFFLYQIVPYWKLSMQTRLNILMGGYELLFSTCLGILIQGVLLIRRLFSGLEAGQDIALFTASVLLALGVGFLMAINGFIRIMVTAKQIKLTWRIVWVLCWWIPFVNLAITMQVCHMVSRECKLEAAKQELNAVRKENEICSTKYPVLLVHGVFFRDWQYFNYWGRIPAELQRNGCQVYYGRHQSAASVKDSAKGTPRRAHRLMSGNLIQ